MRVLFYNWADYLDREGRGGGVSVYQRNLIEGLASQDGVETAFLSAGLAHDLRRRAPKIVTLQTGKSPRYILVNSGLIAPSHANFGGPAQLDHPATEAAFARFIDRTGPWDVIHFNNLEGLPANILALKHRWPGTKFVLSLHNYYPFCPQVNLWHAERDPCTDFDHGRKCATCLPGIPDPRPIRLAYGIGWRMSRLGAGPGTVFYDRAFRPLISLAWRSLRRVLRLRHRPQPAPTATPRQNNGHAYAQRRKRMVGLINTYCDTVLCVSDRVRQIAEHYGLDPARLQTQYIGTKEAAAWARTTPRTTFLDADGTLRLAYLGYMRRDKGFHFLMQALADLPPEIAGRVHLTIAARPGDADALRLMAKVTATLKAVHHVDGYSHADLDDLLASVHLGVIPVMWEDNLPQVAVEMHARHIPLLTSDRGGAQELGNCPALVFKAGNAPDFTHKLREILAGTTTPAPYWATARPPVAMADHIPALLALYRAPR